MKIANFWFHSRVCYENPAQECGIRFIISLVVSKIAWIPYENGPTSTPNEE